MKKLMWLKFGIAMIALSGCGALPDRGQLDVGSDDFQRSVNSFLSSTEQGGDSTKSDEAPPPGSPAQPPPPSLFDLLARQLEIVYDGNKNRIFDEDEREAAIKGLEEMRRLREEKLAAFTTSQELEDFLASERADIEERMDRNEDGSIDDFEKSIGVLAVVDKIVAEFLEKFDSNDDRHITVEESEEVLGAAEGGAGEEEE